MNHRKANASSQSFYRLWTVSSCAAVMVCLAYGFLVAGGAIAQSAGGQVIKGNTPRFVSFGKNMGLEDASETISVTLWLNPHNRSTLDSLAEQNSTTKLRRITVIV